MKINMKICGPLLSDVFFCEHQSDDVSRKASSQTRTRRSVLASKRFNLRKGEETYEIYRSVMFIVTVVTAWCLRPT